MPPLPSCIIALAGLSALLALACAAMAVWHGLRLDHHCRHEKD